MQTREACYSRRNRAKGSFKDPGGVELYKPSMAFDFQYSHRSALQGDVHGFYFLISEAVISLYLRGISVEFLQGSEDPSPDLCLLGPSWERPSFSAASQPDWGEDSELPLSLEC